MLAEAHAVAVAAVAPVVEAVAAPEAAVVEDAGSLSSFRQAHRCLAPCERLNRSTSLKGRNT